MRARRDAHEAPLAAGPRRSGASRGEVFRAVVVFTAIGIMLGAVVWRLVDLIVEHGPQREALVQRRTERQLAEAPPRGRILDRRGNVLAEDLPVFEVRAETYFADLGVAGAEADLASEAATLADDLADCLAAGGRDSQARVGARRLLVGRIADAMEAALQRARSRTSASRPRVDFLVAADIRSAAVMEAFAELERSNRWRSLHLHTTTRYERHYPAGEECLGPVGFVADRDCANELRTRLEATEALRGGSPSERTIRVGARKRRFWTERETPAELPDSVFTTLDLDLQRAAQAELEHAVADARADRGSEPSWGALVLCEVATGDVLAMASWVAGSHPRAAAFTPMQYRFEPGSVVKPLVFAVALRHGLVDWFGERVDCTEGAPGRGWRVEPYERDVPRGTRRIYDDHACGVLTPHEVLAQSSNVGAVRIGLRLGARGLEEYVRAYRFGLPSGVGIPGETLGSCKTDLASLPRRQFWYYTGASYCFGYEMTATAVQMLRAYLSLLSGRSRDLRLLAGIESDGKRLDLPLPPPGDTIVGADELALLQAAMTGVVSADEHATGRHVAAMLDRLGVAPGVVAGKTGTSVNKQTRVRTASFAGFAPASAPRYLAFCVLQKDRAEGFYGGRYAAPAAARLLLHALGILDPARATAPGVARAQQVSAVAPERRTVTSAEPSTGR